MRRRLLLRALRATGTLPARARKVLTSAMRHGAVALPSHARLQLACAAAALLSMLAASRADAQSLISRTITIDGTMTDWYQAPSIPANTGQFSTDCSGGQACEGDAIQSTGRDLKHFAFTWDANNLYFFVERYASASNSNTWLFYLDEDTDGLMETGERLFVVDWWGSNRSTNAVVCNYVSDAPGGDPLGGDGETLGGQSSGACTAVYYGQTGGSASGVQMESRLPWSALGMSSPQNIRFHISSSRGMNLPGHVEDNMTGPGGTGGGGQLFPPDMSVAVAASDATVANLQTSTLTVTLTNVYFTPFSAINVNVTLPSQVSYVSHVAPSGTSFVDTNSDGRPDQWQVTSLASQQTRQLQIVVAGTVQPTSTAVSTSVSLASWTGTDTQLGNNTASVNYTVLPTPVLSLSKTANASTVVPGTVVLYTVLATNSAHATSPAVVLQSAIDDHLAFSLDTFGPSVAFQFIDGSPSSGLTPGPIQYSADGGATWTYTPVSEGGGAPAGFDANVTHWRVSMMGTMQSHGALFEIRYAVRVL